VKVWDEPSPATPPQLQGRPGVERIPAGEEEAFRVAPLHNFNKLHPEPLDFHLYHAWNYTVPLLPRMLRAYERLVAARKRRVDSPRQSHDPVEITRRIREEAAQVGMSTVGFTTYDPHYQYADRPHDGTHNNVIVCIVEQDWAATQTAPSGRSERAAVRGYAELVERVAAVSDFIRGMGYQANPQDFVGNSLNITYAVEAGLGQLGLNGQLLTPQAGSRCRIALITTDAPVELGTPVDFGIEKICDTCKLCVQRCPVGAIPAKRKPYRGVVKAKIKTERCYPTMIQTHGCAVCMKVCPVQRYGLQAVHYHYVETGGGILGKGTDELEGYTWPLDRRFYGARSKPRVGSDLVQPDGWHFDQARTEPPAR
jgi:ferredoxin